MKKQIETALIAALFLAVAGAAAGNIWLDRQDLAGFTPASDAIGDRRDHRLQIGLVPGPVKG